VAAEVDDEVLDEVGDVATVLCVFAVWTCRVSLVVVSDCGGMVVEVVGVVCGDSVVAVSAAAEVAAGTSSATAIAAVPSAAPTPVTAVSRRTRRRTRSRCAAAMARLVASMYLP
jgi:hypothetical protein